MLDNESTIPYRAWNLRAELDNAGDTSLRNDDTRIPRESADYRDRFGVVSMLIAIRSTRPRPGLPPFSKSPTNLSEDSFQATRAGHGFSSPFLRFRVPLKHFFLRSVTGDSAL